MALHNLIFDADDTLWESNIHFLEAEDEFIAVLRKAGCALEEDKLRGLVRQRELDVIKRYGYGRRPYGLALRATVETLGFDHRTLETLYAEVKRIEQRLLNRHCEVRPGVRETLAELSSRNRLVLFTKGQADEQMNKLKASGLGAFFSHVEIAWEKDPNTYRELLARLELPVDRTVMIGNSPRSDINPALKVGLRAVYIPHPQTWVYEQEEIESVDGRVITISDFAELRRLF